MYSSLNWIVASTVGHKKCSRFSSIKIPTKKFKSFLTCKLKQLTFQQKCLMEKTDKNGLFIPVSMRDWDSFVCTYSKVFSKKSKYVTWNSLHYKPILPKSRPNVQESDPKQEKLCAINWILNVYCPKWMETVIRPFLDGYILVHYGKTLASVTPLTNLEM